METPLRTETPVGIRIDTMIEQDPNGPMIIRFVYMLDTLKFKKWVEDHTYLMDGYASVFNVKGIDILFAAKASRTDGKVDWEHAEFCLADKDRHNMPISMKLKEKEVIFVVHRNPISNKEWSVFLPDCKAAQSRLTEE